MCHSVDPTGWRVILDEAVTRVADRFVRAELRRTAGQFVEGLLSGVERKTCWSLAERAGHDDPQAMQRLLRTAVWDADAVRSPALPTRGILARSPRPSHRRRRPDDVGFATKPALARQMIAAALDAGVPVGWVTGDEVYGADPGLRADLEHRGIGYVLAVGCDRRVHVNDGRTLIRVDDLADRIPTAEWQQHSCGPGAKGPRDYLWAWVTTATSPGEHRWLLIRRNRTTGELAFYLCWSPRLVPLHTLVTVDGSRWSVEELFQTGKGQVGLDHYQVRGWTGWHRFVTLAMLALAVLTILAATTAQQPDPDPEIIALTVAEIRRLLNAFVLALPLPPAHTLHWSSWRRTSQARARRSHYQRRLGHLA
ncbi:IS701 family transposase [Plantactinospora alkalitolerans]|uniref:IS701 family transposase n=1 Tax=Plantactinospora alkalitolerans TaxID=2789879 RepID=UPI002B1F35EB|nr:IS701 family transposase [Plantactinospora alkalitolerans]